MNHACLCSFCHKFCWSFFFSLIHFRISCLPNTMIQICALTFAAVNLFTITHLRHMSRLTWCLKTLVGISLLEGISLAQLRIALSLCKYFFILLVFQKSVKHCQVIVVLTALWYICVNKIIFFATVLDSSPENLSHELDSNRSICTNCCLLYPWFFWSAYGSS